MGSRRKSTSVQFAAAPGEGEGAWWVRMPTTCFRPWQARFSKRYEIGGAAQHNLLPPTLPSRGLHGFAKEEYQCSIRRSARRGGGSILPSPSRLTLFSPQLAIDI